MAKAIHIVRRNNTFYWRKRIPREMVDKCQRKEFMISLQTSDRRNAYAKANVLTGVTERLFSILHTMPTLSKAEIDQLIINYFHREMEKSDNCRALNGHSWYRGKEGETAREAHERIVASEVNRHKYYMILGVKYLRVDSSEEVDAEVAKVLEGSGIQLSPDSKEYGLIYNGSLRAKIEKDKLELAREWGDYTVEPEDSLFRKDAVNLEDLLPIDAQDMQKVSKLLSVCINEYLENLDSRQVHSTLRMFMELHGGDLPIDEVTRRYLTKYRDVLRTIPNKHGQLAAYKDLTLPDKATLADDGYSGAFVSERTIKRQFSELSVFFDWCREREYVEENPTKDFTWTRAVSARNEWDEFSSEDLNKLLSSPIWSGSHSQRRRNRSGEVIVKDWHYWIPLVGLYSGMRLNEICQLEKSDIKERDGVYYFDVNNEGCKRLKNTESARAIPIHRDLLSMGFMSFVSNQEDGNLWGLTLSSGGYYSEKPSRAFGRTLEAIGLKRDKLSFKSFRRTFASALQNGGVSEEMAASLMGHTFQSMSYGRYSRGLDNMGSLQNAVDVVYLDILSDSSD